MALIRMYIFYKEHFKLQDTSRTHPKLLQHFKSACDEIQFYEINKIFPVKYTSFTS